MGAENKHVFTKNIMLASQPTLSISRFTEIARRTIQAGELIAIGNSVDAGQNDSTGRIFAKLMDTTATPVEMQGTVRIWVHDASDQPIYKVFEGHTSELSATQANRITWRVLPQGTVWAKENSSFVVSFKPDSVAGTTSILDPADCIMFIDATLQNV